MVAGVPGFDTEDPQATNATHSAQAVQALLMGWIALEVIVYPVVWGACHCPEESERPDRVRFAVEAVEHVPKVVRRESPPVVADADQRVVGDRDLDRLARGVPFDRVVEQVVHCPFQAGVDA